MSTVSLPQRDRRATTCFCVLPIIAKCKKRRKKEGRFVFAFCRLVEQEAHDKNERMLTVDPM